MTLREACSIWWPLCGFATGCDETHWHGCVQEALAHWRCCQSPAMIAAGGMAAARREEPRCRSSRSYGRASWAAAQGRSSTDKRLLRQDAAQGLREEVPERRGTSAIRKRSLSAEVAQRRGSLEKTWLRKAADRRSSWEKRCLSEEVAHFEWKEPLQPWKASWNDYVSRMFPPSPKKNYMLVVSQPVPQQ